MTEERSIIKSDLRRRMLGARGNLADPERRRLDRQLRAHLLRFISERECIHIAGFVAHAGEPDPMPVLEVLHHAGCRVYLPVIAHDGKSMAFHRWHPEQDMQPNRFGIPEPPPHDGCPPEKLDVVCAPLVAFTPAGIRLGMGMGFYDRTFEFLGDPDNTSPLLIGVAYGFQEVDELPAESWDVPLAGVVTEEGARMFRE